MACYACSKSWEMRRRQTERVVSRRPCAMNRNGVE